MAEIKRPGKGGAGRGQGRKKKEIVPTVGIDGRTQSGQEHAQGLIDQLNAICFQWPVSDIHSLENTTPEVRSWIPYWVEKHGAGLDARKFLYDKAKGKAVIAVNHMHDKPLEVNMNVSMSALIREVRERKQNYERSRK